MADKCPELEVKNVWCPNCGRQRFEHRHTLLICLHCGTSIEWSNTWKEWFGRSSPCLLGFDLERAPSGTKWKSEFDGYQYTMVSQYNPNTGKKVTDPKVVKALSKIRSCLMKKLEKVDHELKSVKR